jgi:hypothetical protein
MISFMLCRIVVAYIILIHIGCEGWSHIGCEDWFVIVYKLTSPVPTYQDYYPNGGRHNGVISPTIILIMMVDWLGADYACLQDHPFLLCRICVKQLLDKPIL